MKAALVVPRLTVDSAVNLTTIERMAADAVSLEGASFIRNNVMPSTLQEAYELVKNNPILYDPIPETDLELCYVYKQQIITIYELPQFPASEQPLYLIEELYTPFQDFWRGFGYRDPDQFAARFVEAINEAEDDIEQLIEHPGFQMAFQVNFEQVFAEVAQTVAKLSGKRPKGRWFLEFGEGGDLGGFGRSNMFANLLNIDRHTDIDIGYLRFILPHEMQHQIIDEAHPDEPWTLLRCIMVEGFCCFFNYLHWDRAYSPARNIDFTEEEWSWCIAHEQEIYQAAKPHMDSTDQAIIWSAPLNETVS